MTSQKIAKPPSPLKSPFKSLLSSSTLPPIGTKREKGRRNNESRQRALGRKLSQISTMNFYYVNAYRFRIPIAEDEATFLWI